MKLYYVIIFFLSLFITACAGIGGVGSITRTNQLAPGMSLSEVKGVLGEPSQTQFIANKWVWKYSLHQPWKGWVPYYLVFGKENQKLEAWYANEAEYMQQQRLWRQAFPPTQKHEIDVNIK